MPLPDILRPEHREVPDLIRFGRCQLRPVRRHLLEAGAPLVIVLSQKRESETLQTLQTLHQVVALLQFVHFQQVCLCTVTPAAISARLMCSLDRCLGSRISLAAPLQPRQGFAQDLAALHGALFTFAQVRSPRVRDGWSERMTEELKTGSQTVFEILRIDRSQGDRWCHCRGKLSTSIGCLHMTFLGSAN